MTAPEQRDIDWASAEVEAATLTQSQDPAAETRLDEEVRVDRRMTAVFRASASD